MRRDVKDEKLLFLGFTKKTIYRGELPIRREAWTVSRFKGGGA